MKFILNYIRVKATFMRYMLFILTLLILVSYGQLLRMNFWQDDNAVVFKFTHIDEHAGYLGRGVFGEGPYKYTITPYLPIFDIFGYNPVPYFTLALVFIILSTYAIYFFFIVLFEDKIKAATASTLYACGYVASDGFIRMFNSVLSSTAVILTCATIGFYYMYMKTRKPTYYLTSLVFCFLAIEIGYIRTHFLIFVVIAIELIYNIDKFKGISYKLTLSLLRISPFTYLFYHYYVMADDSRTGQVGVLINAILKGEFYNTYSFFGTLGNIILANEIFPKIYNYIHLTEKQTILGLILILILICLYFVKNRLISIKLGLIYIGASTLLLFESKHIFANPGLIGGTNEKISVYFGIFVILLGLLLFKVLSGKKIIAVFAIWAILNLAAYAAYIPIYAYPSDNRYLLQSFIPIIGIFTLWTFGIWQKFNRRGFAYVPVILLILWGGINMYSSLSWQKQIINHRANPSKRFFNQLQEYYPQIQKNSILYFYIPNKPFAEAHYNAGFGVAQMPEETAIAWRYGIDRYDISIVNTFEDLKNRVLKENIQIDKVYAFIADPDDLIDVTTSTRELLINGSSVTQQLNLSSNAKLEDNKNGSKLIMQPSVIRPSGISALTPVKLTLYLSANPMDVSTLIFPVQIKNSSGSIDDTNLRKHYIDYRNWKDYFYKTASVSATTIWKNFKVENLLDKDENTYWEADRIAWDDHNQGFTVDVGLEESVAGIIYRNGPHSLTPTQFEVQVSLDNKNFTTVKEVVADASKRDDVQKVIFEPTQARYVKLLFHKTQFDDAPGVSEVEILPKRFIDIDLVTAERFYRFPFSEVKTLNQWKDLIHTFKDNGLVKISWKTDSSDNLITNVKSTLPIKYDGSEQKIEIQIPAGGEKLEYLEILPLSIPGEISLSKIIYQNQPLPR